MTVSIRASALSEPHASAPAFEWLLDCGVAAALPKTQPKMLQRMGRRDEVAAILVGELWRFRLAG